MDVLPNSGAFNNGTTNQGPLINNGVTATFDLASLPSGYVFASNSIGNVSFQYGTGAGEAYFGGVETPAPPPVPAPEPSFLQFGTMLALGGLAAPLRRLRARRK